MLTNYHLRLRSVMWLAAGAMLLFATSGAALIRAAEPASGKPLPGFVTASRAFPGIGRWQLAHKLPYGRIVALAWNGDGSQIAFNDHSYVRLCDAQTLETKTFLVGHARDVTSIDWNHRTNRLASASCDGTVRIWSGAGVPEKVLQTDGGEVKSVAWTNDGSLLAASTSCGGVWIWNADGSVKATLKGKAPINAVAWSADKTKLAGGDDDGHLKLWNPEGKLLGDSSAHLARVTAVAWSPDGKHFASMTYGEKDPTSERYHSELRIWKEDGSLAAAVPGRVPFGAFCFSPDGQQVAVYDCYEMVRVYDLKGSDLETRRLGSYLVTLPKGAAWAPRGQQIALGDIGGLRVIELGNRKLRTTPQRSCTHTSRPKPIAITSRDGEKWLVLRSNGEPYQLWTVGGQVAAFSKTLARNISQPMWNRAGDAVAFVEKDQSLKLWSVVSPSARLVFESPQNISISAWSPDGAALGTLDEAGNLQVVRPDGKPVLQRKVDPPIAGSSSGTNDSISRILFRADGRAIAVVGKERIQVFPLDGSPVMALAYDKSNAGGEGNEVWWSRDGKRVTSMREEDKEHVQVVAWDLATGQRTTMTDFSDEFGAVDCSSDGKRLLIGFDLGFWQVRRLDDPSAPPLESEPAAHISTVRAVAFSDDGRRFATGGWDGLIKIWSSEGALQQTLDGNDWPVHGLTWTPDGEHLISLGRDRTTLLWSLKTGRPEMRLEADATGNVTLITKDGRIFGPSTAQLDHEFWALIEKRTGEMQSVGYAEFLNRAAGR